MPISNGLFPAAKTTIMVSPTARETANKNAPVIPVKLLIKPLGESFLIWLAVKQEAGLHTEILPDEDEVYRIYKAT